MNLHSLSTIIIVGDTMDDEDHDAAMEESGRKGSSFCFRGSAGGSASATFSTTNVTTTTPTATITKLGRGLCLGLRFEQKLVLYRFDRDYRSGERTRSGTISDGMTTMDKDPCMILCCLEGQWADIVQGIGGRRRERDMSQRPPYPSPSLHSFTVARTAP